MDGRILFHVIFVGTYGLPVMLFGGRFIPAATNPGINRDGKNILLL
jgi:hypothetical protein